MFGKRRGRNKCDGAVKCQSVLRNVSWLASIAPVATLLQRQYCVCKEFALPIFTLRENTANLSGSDTLENCGITEFFWGKTCFVAFVFPSGCLLFGCIFTFAHTHCCRITKKSSAFSPNCTAGQRPKRPQMIISREGRSPPTVCLVENSTAAADEELDEV